MCKKIEIISFSMSIIIFSVKYTMDCFINVPDCLIIFIVELIPCASDTSKTPETLGILPIITLLKTSLRFALLREFTILIHSTFLEHPIYKSIDHHGVPCGPQYIVHEGKYVGYIEVCKNSVTKCMYTIGASCTNATFQINDIEYICHGYYTTSYYAIGFIFNGTTYYLDDIDPILIQVLYVTMYQSLTDPEIIDFLMNKTDKHILLRKTFPTLDFTLENIFDENSFEIYES